MDNLNFIPKSFQDRYTNLSIKKLKNIILTLWIFCLVLFAGFNYLKNKNEKLNNQNEYKISYVNEPSSNNNKANIRDNTLNSLEKFLQMPQKDLYYKSASITDKEINLDLIIKDVKQYYQMVENIESSTEYKILYLSPLNDKNNILNFQMIVEVN